ncbi:response regulator [Rhodoligotrophos defluvii]|uniref:response regulator n=1 Tax=Rhodoligotrophos defluvii TaxID=2561934 RepID=UPI0010C9FAB0|nr:response regulator [Rhodoligotrophos defluvii]
MKAGLQGCSVLIIEDNFLLADDMRQTLEDAGAEVIGPFGNATAVAAALEARKVDCALVDLNLGDGPTFEPARTLMARGVKVVLLTGYDATVIPADLASVPCLQKPADTRKVLDAVGDLCAQLSMI